MKTKQHKVIYQMNKGLVKERLFFTNNAVETLGAFSRACPGVPASAILEIVEILPALAKRGLSLESVSRKTFSLSPEKKSRLVDIFTVDPKFSMPISAPPEQEDAVNDEITNASDGLTIASPQKMFTSYDTVFSFNSEVNDILEGSGGEAIPYFDSRVICLFKGPRKAFYNFLLDAGFKPTRMGAQ